MDRLTPKNHSEEVAVFRHGLIGELALRELDHGERSAALRRLSEQRVRAPGSEVTRCYSVPTLERWLYAFKRGGLEALAPRARTDRGRGRDLVPALRELLCDIRRERPRRERDADPAHAARRWAHRSRGERVHRAPDVRRTRHDPHRRCRWQGR
jgi:hypothetical protein